jgi:hypothetical protein
MVGPAGANAAWSLWIGGASFACVAALWLAARRSPRMAFAIVVFGCLELMVHGRCHRPTFDPAPALHEADLLAQLVQRTGSEHRILTKNPYAGMSAGAFDVWGRDPMILRRYAEFIAFTQGKPEPDLAVWLRRLPPLFGLVRLRYSVTIDDDVLQAEPTGFDELPRALLVPRWHVVDGREATLTTLAQPTFDERQVVLLETDPGLVGDATPPEPGQENGTVRVTDRSTDVLEIWADVPRPSILLVSDGYSDGWTATPLDDGDRRRYRVVPADYILRGIPLEPGRHHLRLEYRPRAFVVGAWVSAASLLVYAGLVAVCFARRRRSEG